LLANVPDPVVTVTLPVLEPAGTVAVTSVFETTWNDAAVPLKLTPVVLDNFVPRILTFVPTLPALGTVSTNGCSPVVNSKINVGVVP
jgi:hypothetical protein